MAANDASQARRGMSRSWIFRYERAGKLRSMGLGSLIAIDLWWRLEDAAHGRDL
jgi:hypothetical protein